MPARKGHPGAPRDYVAPHGAWPQGPFIDDAPLAARYAAAIAAGLDAAIMDRGMTRVDAARAMGVARPTLYDLLGGVTFPDLFTVVKAEQMLGMRLWPNFGDT
ncbi:MAG: cro/C1-type protein [Actinomycetota bacterium]|nr:cro/C1-type protein [Actinomycetota bacterium]